MKIYLSAMCTCSPQLLKEASYNEIRRATIKSCNRLWLFVWKIISTAGRLYYASARFTRTDAVFQALRGPTLNQIQNRRTSTVVSVRKVARGSAWLFLLLNRFMCTNEFVGIGVTNRCVGSWTLAESICLELQTVEGRAEVEDESTCCNPPSRWMRCDWRGSLEKGLP